MRITTLLRGFLFAAVVIALQHPAAHAQQMCNYIGGTLYVAPVAPYDFGVELAVKNGVIVRVKNRRTNQWHTPVTPPAGSPAIHRGMQTSSIDPANPSDLTLLQQAAVLNGPNSPPPNGGTPFADHVSFHHPYAASTVVQGLSGPTYCSITWTKLASGPNDVNTFPTETLKLEFQWQTGNRLAFRATANSPKYGVMGVMTPIANLFTDHRVYVPSMGGMVYDASLDSGEIFSLDAEPWWEAPVVAMEHPTAGSIGLWIEDPTLQPNMFFFSRGSGSFALGLEQFNTMRAIDSASMENPFSHKKSVTSQWIRIDGFAGSWVDAMAPYKNWYATTFATELGNRGSVTWDNPGVGSGPDDIKVIIDEWARPPEQPGDAPSSGSPAYYQQLASYFTPGSVLLFENDARNAVFDSELPEHQGRRVCSVAQTPYFCEDDSGCGAGGGTCGELYPNRNTVLRGYGFRTMSYVNAFVVNPHVDADADGIPSGCSSMGSLPYGPWSEEMITDIRTNMTIGGHTYDRKIQNVNELKGFVEFPKTFARCDQDPTCNPLWQIYLDPIVPWWRCFHRLQMIDWKNDVGFDATYEDTIGLVEDAGNGDLGGISGPRGATEFMREIVNDTANLGVPMATEYAPDAVAFGAHWPSRFNLAFSRANENDPPTAFHEWLSTHTRPVGSYLFGPKQAAWVRTQWARDNSERHLIASFSEALGGVVPVEAGLYEYRATAGDIGHQKRRGQLYASEKLTPYFGGTWPYANTTLVAKYANATGGVYEYHILDNGNRQELRDPSGQVRYARIRNQSSFNTDTTLLRPAGWPAYSATQIFGLDSTARYNLEAPQGTPYIVVPEITTSGVKVSSYYETPTQVVLVLDQAPGSSATSATFKVQRNGPVCQMLVNDVADSIPPLTPGTKQITASLPAKVVFLRAVPHDWGNFCPNTCACTDFIPAPSYADTTFGSSKTKQLCSGTASGNSDNVCPGEGSGVLVDIGHFVERETGIDRGGARESVVAPTDLYCDPYPCDNTYDPAHGDTYVTPLAQRIDLRLQPWGENAPHRIDYLVKVPAPVAQWDSTHLEVLSCVLGSGATRAVVYVNGREVGELSDSKSCYTDWNSAQGRLLVNMDAYVGQDVLISVAYDNGADSNPNGDHRLTSRPRFVSELGAQ